jgi:hypothetical protein
MVRDCDPPLTVHQPAAYNDHYGTALTGHFAPPALHHIGGYTRVQFVIQSAGVAANLVVPDRPTVTWTQHDFDARKAEQSPEARMATDTVTALVREATEFC